MEPEEKTEITSFSEQQQEQVEEQLEELKPEKSKLEFLEKFWFIPVILAIVAVVVVGSLWAVNQGWLAPKASPTPTPLPSPTSGAETDESITALEEQGASDEVSAIEADIGATDLSDLDKELTDIENEFSTP